MSAPNSDSNYEASSDEDVELQTRDDTLLDPSQSSETLDPQSPGTTSATNAKETTLEEGQVQTNRVIPTLMDNPYADEPTLFHTSKSVFWPR